MNENIIPSSISEVLLHSKDTDMKERVVFPITQYRSVLSAPQVITGPTDVYGAPFNFLATDEEDLSTEQIRKLCGRII